MDQDAREKVRIDLMWAFKTDKLEIIAEDGTEFEVKNVRVPGSEGIADPTDLWVQMVIKPKGQMERGEYAQSRGS